MINPQNGHILCGRTSSACSLKMPNSFLRKFIRSGIPCEEEEERVPSKFTFLASLLVTLCVIRFRSKNYRPAADSALDGLPSLREESAGPLSCRFAPGHAWPGVFLPTFCVSRMMGTSCRVTFGSSGRFFSPCLRGLFSRGSERFRFWGQPADEEQAAREQSLPDVRQGLLSAQVYSRRGEEQQLWFRRAAFRQAQPP